MASIVEHPQWEDQIYLLELYDPVQGGLIGASNYQAQQLANRTRYLLDRFLVEHTKEGQHLLKTKSIAPDAAIEESKLALDYSIKDLVAALEELSKARETVASKVDSFSGTSDSLINVIYRALLLSWQYGDNRMAVDLFNSSFTFQDAFKDQPVLKTVAGDDSVDIKDTSEVTVGGKYFIYGTDVTTGQRAIQEVEVWKVLSDTRVVFTTDLTYSSTDGYLTRAAYTVNDDEGYALLKEGHVYYTKLMSTLKGVGSGELYIKQDTDDINALQVYVVVDEGRIFIDPTSISYDGTILYKMPGREFRLYIKANKDVKIDYMLLQHGTTHLAQSLVRTPYITTDNKGFYATRYGCYYDVAYKHTEVELKRGNNTFNCLVDDLGWPHSGIEVNSYNNPLWCYDFLNYDLYGDTLPEWMFSSNPSAEDPIIWRIRHQNSEDTWSEWSDYGTTTSW